MTREVWVLECRIVYPSPEEWRIELADDRFTEKSAKKIANDWNYKNAYAEYRATRYTPAESDP